MSYSGLVDFFCCSRVTGHNHPGQHDCSTEAPSLAPYMDYPKACAAPPIYHLKDPYADYDNIWEAGDLKPASITTAVVKEGRMALSCHHRGITRSRAEDLLLDRNEDGCFLVRDSETIPNAYTLSILYQGSVRQYRILPDKDGLLYMQTGKEGQERRYVDLVQLIHETIQRSNNNGLVCALKYPIAVEPDEDDKDSDDEDDSRTRERTESMTSQYEYYSLPSQQEPAPVTKDFAGRANVEMISTYFISRLTALDLSKHDSEFITKLRDYSDEGVHRDIVEISSGKEQLNEFRKIVTHSATELNKQLNIFLSKLDTLRQYFGYAASPMATRKDIEGKERRPIDLQEVLEKCTQCKQVFSSIEKKAVKTLNELKSKEWDVVDGNIHVSSGRAPCAADLPARRKTPVTIQPMHYRARLQKHGKPGPKMTLMVDVQNGKFLAVKNSQDSLDDSNTFYHDKIEQVIKCTANKCRLDMQIEGRKKETYLFEDVWTRENFCQMIQELQTFHASSQEVEHLSIFLGTWNMGDEVPPFSLGSWLKSQGVGKARSRSVGLIPHDLYVIGTQESSLTEKDWVNRIKASLQETLAYDVHDMHTLITVSMWSLRLVVLVRSDYKNKISHVQHSTVKTGIANKLGNKGAIGVSFYFDGTAFCFVNCHLTSGIERNAKRNKNVADIIKGLKFTSPRKTSSTAPAESVSSFMRNQNVHDIIKGLSLGQKSSVFDITNQFHHVFFLGDLNYRMEGMEPQEIIKKLSHERGGNHDYSSLLVHDQLLKAQSNSDAFFGFREQDITFPPTYRIVKGSLDEYSWQKVKKTGVRINAPSWCDRVLWKSYPETYIKGTSYGFVEDVKTSDHKPLFASFDVGIIPQTVSPKVKSPMSGGAQILFQEITAEVKTRTRDIFRVSFYSRCLDGIPESETNEEFVSNKIPHYSCPKWNIMQLPKVIPIFDDREYLEDQHILLAVKTADGMESFGECVIALKPMFSSKPEPFESFLTHKGECTGKIKGLMYVKMATPAEGHVKRRRKSYELICLDTDVPRLFTQVSSPPTLQEEDSEMRSSEDTNQKYSLLRENATRDRNKRGKSENLLGSLPREFDHLTDKRFSESPSAAGGEDPPAIPARLPRMGKASLTTTNVLPIVARTSNNNNASHSPPLPPSRTTDENSNVRRHATVQESFRSLPVYLDERDANLRTSVLGGLPPDGPPPIVPRRKPKDTTDSNVSKPASYDKLQKPGTINQWLLDLGLPCYIPMFYENGWDELDYISSISESDLIAMKIHDKEHRERIMKSVLDMSQ